MRIELNGRPREVTASLLSDVVDELGYEGSVVATALNKTFVPRSERAVTAIRDGDAIEIIMPMKGG